MATPAKLKCKYWNKCYQKSKAHKSAYLHPGDVTKDDEDDDGDVQMKSIDSDDNDAGASTSDTTKKGIKRKRVEHDMSQRSSDEDGDTDDEINGAAAAAPVKKVVLSDVESDDEPQPAKKAKTTTDTAAADTAKAKKDKKKLPRCKYWSKCYQKSSDHKKNYLHPADLDSEDEEDEVEPKHKIKDGEIVDLQSGTNTYRIKKTGNDYTCNCTGWKNQTKAINKRTCKHLKSYLGEKFEEQRTTKEESHAGDEHITRGARHISISLLLAHKYDEDNVNPVGWWISEKLDGVRAYWNGKSFYSRLGNEFIPPSWFIKGMPSDMTLDGELFGGRGNFQSTVSVVKTPGSGRWGKITYHIFDAPSLGKQPFEKRVDAIKEYFKKNHAPFVVVCEHTKCEGKKQLKTELARVEALGAEGLMIREPKSQYEQRRSHTLLKIKTFHDAEAVVIAHEKGKGRNQYVCGAMRCRMECGKEFSVGSGLSDAQRRKPPKVGAIITYRFQEYTNSGTPRFPTFVGVRVDVDGPKDAILIKKGGGE